MSYFGRKADAKADCLEADIQIDGTDPSNTSPVRDGGGMKFGLAPLSGTTEFTKERTRPGWVGRRTSMRREFPAEGVSKK